MLTVLSEQQQFEVAARKPAPGAWVDSADLARVTGFQLKPEGLCKDAICVPVRGKPFVDADGPVDLAGFWRFMGNPVVQDDAGETVVLGTGAETRTQTLQSLDAPDFALPDVDGQLHALADYRNRKVLLVTWASW